MDKKSFLFHYDWVELLMDCGVEVRYEVYDAIMRYAQSGTLSELKPLAGMAFKIIKIGMDEDRRKYAEAVEKRREAGKLHRGNQYSSNGTNGTNGTSVPNCKKRTNSKSSLKNTNGTNGTSVPLGNYHNNSEFEGVVKSGMEHNGTNGTDNDNDGVYIIGDKKKDNTNVLSKESEHPEFDELMEQFPTVQKMEKPLTFEEYTRAVEAYSQDEVVDTLGQMENKRGLSKLYVSANLTLRKWLQLHRERQGGGKGDNPHPEIKLGIKEFFDNGRRTYGDGTYTIPLDAPPRPSERHYWNTSTHQWLI